MRKILSSLIGLFCLITISSCGPTSSDAIEHNDTIVADQSQILTMEENLIDALSNNKPKDSIKAEYNNYCTFLENTAAKYNKMQAFDKDDSFRKEMISYIETFLAVSKNEYKKMIDIYMKDTENISEEDTNNWDKLISKIDSTEGSAVNNFLEAQKKFADQYGFQLIAK